MRCHRKQLIASFTDDTKSWTSQKGNIPLPITIQFNNVGQYHCNVNYFPFITQQTGRRRGINVVCIDATLFLEFILNHESSSSNQFNSTA